MLYHIKPLKWQKWGDDSCSAFPSTGTIWVWKSPELGDWEWSFDNSTGILRGRLPTEEAAKSDVERVYRERLLQDLEAAE